METFFITRLRKSTSAVISFALLFQIVSPWSNVASGIGTSFQKNLVQANVPAVSEVKASRTLTVTTVPSAWETLTIGTSTITFVDIPWIDGSQLNTISGTWQIDLTYGTGDILRSTHEIAASLRGLTYVFDIGHGELAMSWSADTAVFTTVWGESSPTPISFTNGTSGDITSTASTDGALPMSAVAQVVDFTPVMPIDHRIYRAKINGTSYSYSTSSSTNEQEIVEALKASMDTHSDVSCTENDIKITCTADVAWVAFTYDTEIVDKTPLYDALNAEYSDGASRTTYKLTEANYTPTSWNAYIQSITDGFLLETNLGATSTGITDAIALIDTRKSELAIPFTNTYDITDNSTADSNLDADSYDGKTYVTYGRDGNIYLKEWIGSEEFVGTGTSPVIAVGSWGIVHIAYENGWNIMYAKKTSSWISEIVATGNSVDIDVDSGNFAHVVYQTNSDGDGYAELAYSKNTSGSFVQTIFADGWYSWWDWWGSTADYYESIPLIKIDANWNYHIVYQHHHIDRGWWWTDHSYELKYDTDIPWASANKWGNYSINKNSLTLDNNNKAHILYWSSYYWYISSWVWTETNLWISTWSPSVSADWTSIWVAYNSWGDVKYIQNDGSGFIGSTLIASTASNPAVAMNNGEVYVYYIKHDGSDDEVKLASTTAVYSVPGQIDNASDSFVLATTGNVQLSGLEIGWVYMLMNGSTMVSSGVLIANSTTGNLWLNPSLFMNYGNYTLTLSGSYDGTTTSSIASKSLYIGPFDYQDLYANQIAPALLANGVVTNLGNVTYSNVASFSGLYFEETGMGKISFSASLDLTNSGTILFLQNLPTKLDIAWGNIHFDPTDSDFANYGAGLSMYFDTGSTFVGGITDPDKFVVKTSTGVVIDSNTVLSNVHWACGVGEAYCTIFFDTAHFTSFDLKPILTDVHITSNSAYSGWALAKDGDQFVLTFTGSESLAGIVVTFDGVPARNINAMGGTYYSAASELSHTGNGLITFSIDYQDLTGNTGTTITGTTDGSSVTLDTILPTANIEYSVLTPTAQDVIATLTGASEDITVTNNGGNTSFTFTGNGTFTFQFRDQVGNTGSETATVSNINKSLPTVTLNGSGTLSIEQGDSYTELGANWSDGTDGTGAVSILSGSIDTNILWIQQVEYLYVNSLWLTGSTTRTVTIVDTVSPGAPTLTTPSMTTSGSSLSNLTGSGEVDATISLYKNGSLVCGGNTVNGSGSFVIVNFSSCLSLVEWTNTFTAYARDTSGNTSGTGNTITITRDSTPPSILYTEVRSITENEATLEFASNENGLTLGNTLIEIYEGAFLIGTGTIDSYTGGLWSKYFNGLNSNATHTFVLRLADDAGNTITETGTFTTALSRGFGEVPTDIYETGGILFGSVDGSMGSGDTFSLGGNNVYISSDPNDSDSASGTLTLSGVDIIVSSGSWNGILLPPNILDNNNPLAATGSEIGTWVTVVQTVQAGAEDASLTATGGYFLVSFMIPGYPVGTTFTIYRSEDGTTWVPVTPDSTCTLDAGLLCTFRTDHLSLFAPAVDTTPDAFTFTPTTGAELNTYSTSNAITVSGISTGSVISVTGGEYQIGTGAFTSAAWLVSHGDTVKVRLTTSTLYSTAKSATLTIGGVSSTYTATTKAPSSGGGSGGGGTSTPIDTCPNGDTSGNFYDGKCTPSVISTQTGTTGSSAWSGNIWDPAPSFNDISESFAREYIEELVSLGIVGWYDDGGFHPESPITRAEWLKMILWAFDIPLESGVTTTFTDIPSETAWIIPYINTAKKLGIIKGQMQNGKLLFRPNDPISRAEALKIVFEASGENITSLFSLPFVDSDFVSWMIPYVIRASELGIVNGQWINGKLLFRPNDPISRAEAAKILVKFLSL
jgi:hypothetical protein